MKTSTFSAREQAEIYYQNRFLNIGQARIGQSLGLNQSQVSKIVVSIDEQIRGAGLEKLIRPERDSFIEMIIQLQDGKRPSCCLVCGDDHEA